MGRCLNAWRILFAAALIILVSSSAATVRGSAEEFSVIVSPQEEEKKGEEAAAAFVVEVIQNESEMSREKLRVLIYHTHTYEAYEQNPDDVYVETEKWRTKDDNHNVVAVGEALTSCLEALGIEVVHDRTSFEPPSIDQAYERSRLMLENRMADGDVYDLIVDLHRDALSSQASIKKTVNIGGEDVARFMVLIGQGTTGGYTEKPDWESNLVIAQAITDTLNAQCDGLARNVKIKTGRFNQHISDRCVLIECGVNTNTLEEVISGVPYLAEAIRQTLENSTKKPSAE